MEEDPLPSRLVCLRSHPPQSSAFATMKAPAPDLILCTCTPGFLRNDPHLDEETQALVVYDYNIVRQLTQGKDRDPSGEGSPRQVHILWLSAAVASV